MENIGHEAILSNENSMIAIERFTNKLKDINEIYEKKNMKRNFVASNLWNSRKNKVVYMIRSFIIDNKEDILENYSYILENEKFFIILIRDIFVFLKNKTDLLNRLNIDQLKEIPSMIYGLAKVSFSAQRSIYKETEFLEKINNLYGFIYVGINTVKGKVYIGQTFRTIEIEWGSLLTDARILIRKNRSGEKLYRNLKRYIIRAIAKYGIEAWNLKLLDIAYSKAELDDKEDHYILEYESMNPKKGYNLKRGGSKGKPSPEVLKKMSRSISKAMQNPKTRKKMSTSITELWQTSEYRKKQSRCGIWQTPEYRKKQIEIMKEIAKTPENKIKRSEASRLVWGDQIRREKFSKNRKEAYKNDSEYREMLDKALEKAHKARRIEIQDVRQFLIDVKNSSRWVVVVRKYPFKSRDTLNARLKEILEPFGIRNYTMAKKFLECREIDDVLKKLRDFRSRG